MTTSSLGSFARQFVVVLKDSRLWVVVLPFLLIVSLVFSLVGPRLAAVLSFTLGIVASYLINQIDRLPAIGDLSSLKNLTERILIPAVAGILIIPGAEVLTRIWLMPWYWFHSSDQNPSCSYLMGGAVWHWLGFLVCGALLAALTRERSTFAAIAGATVFIPLSFTDIFTGNLIQQTFSVFASSCKWLDMKDSDVESFRFGIAIGLVVRVLLAIFAARLVSSWLISREKT
jgi:hypothetical protein